MEPNGRNKNETAKYLSNNSINGTQLKSQPLGATLVNDL